MPGRFGLGKVRTWFSRRTNPGVRALAFTCSRHRPVMLRHCIMQFQRQSYPIDHAIYVNSPEDELPDRTSLHYEALLDDVRKGESGKVRIAYGKSKTPHENNIAVLRMMDIDDYDLFFKIDDDDIYLRSYVEDVVDDFLVNRWDYSGTCSHGLLNGHRWSPQKIQQDLGLAQEDLDLRIPGFMPPSAAFSRKAIRAILQAPGSDLIEDIHWRRLLARTPDLIIALRDDRNFVYNIHGGNMSTASWLQP
jgi:hypothetical protein